MKKKKLSCDCVLSPEECKKAMKQTQPGKSPESDGLPIEFIKYSGMISHHFSSTPLTRLSIKKVCCRLPKEEASFLLYPKEIIKRIYYII